MVIRDTALHHMMLAGTYTPLSEEEAVNRSKAMYEILENAGINIIRVGLKSSDILASETAFHPAFRQLVEGRIARERLETALQAAGLTEHPASDLRAAADLQAGTTGAASRPEMAPALAASDSAAPAEALFFSNEKCYNNMFGHKACNRKYFEEKYPQLHFRFAVDPELKNNEYKVKLSTGHTGGTSGSPA